MYHFDGSVRHKAIMMFHGWVRLLLKHYDLVVCHNTYTTRWEMEPQIKAAKDLGAELTVIDLWDVGLSDERLHARNTHNIPLEMYEVMRNRYERDWVNGDPRPPWKRKDATQEK